MRFLWPFRFLPEWQGKNRNNFFWVEGKETNLPKICRKTVAVGRILLLLRSETIFLGYDDVCTEQSLDLPARTDALAKRARMVGEETL